jgi:hypothetical protein
VKKEVHIAFWWGNLKERDDLKDAIVDGRIILKWLLKSTGLGWG